MSTFSVYVTYWENDLHSQITDMIDKEVIKEGVRVILAFASFNFISTQYIPGFGNVTMDDVKNVINMVHSVDAHISLSIGGATYPLYNSDLYTEPELLAENIGGLLENAGFDGVDFDIEDSYNVVPANFSTTAATIITTLRELQPDLNITLTTPAQAWGDGMYQSTLLNLTMDAISAWQPMEYDLWISPDSDYTTQIASDINYYMTQWNVPADKIILGLMCGPDDEDHVLTLKNALDMTTFAQIEELQGVMMWEAAIDARGCVGNAPYAYSLGIQAEL
jgi:chitinase